MQVKLFVIQSSAQTCNISLYFVKLKLGRWLKLARELHVKSFRF